MSSKSIHPKKQRYYTSKKSNQVMIEFHTRLSRCELLLFFYNLELQCLHLTSKLKFINNIYGMVLMATLDL